MPIILPGRYRALGNDAPKWPFVLNKDSPQARDLMGWWPLISDLGVNARDLSGHGDQMSQVSDPGFKAIPPGVVAMDFDGTSNIQISEALLSTTPLTFCCWFILNDVADNHDLFGLHTDGTANQHHKVFVEGTPAITANSKTGSGAGATSTLTLAANRLYQCCAVFGSPTFRAAYTNGAHKGTNTTNRDPSGMDTTSIGRRTYSSDQQIRGQMFGGRLYNRVPTDAEVYEFFDPETRWDLYHELGRKVFFLPPAAGGIVVTPAAAIAAAAKVDPGVVLGALALGPAPAAAAAAKIDPSVELGSLVISALIAQATAGKADPTPVLGSLVIPPGPATAKGASVDPTVVEAGGGITVVPGAATVAGEIAAPVPVLGSLVVGPPPAAARGDTVDPTIALGSLLLALGAAAAPGAVSGPTVTIADPSQPGMVTAALGGGGVTAVCGGGSASGEVTP